MLNIDEKYEVGPAEIKAAHLLWDAYDFDYARSYGPENAFQKAKDTAKTYESVENPLHFPYNMAEYEEWFGCSIEDEEEKQPWFNQTVVESVSNDDFMTYLESLPSSPLVEAIHQLYESASGNSKRKLINKLYTVTNPLTGHLYKDDNWAGVYALVAAIRQNVPEFNFEFGAVDGGYTNPGEDGMPRRKTYTIQGTTPEGFPIVGKLHCDAAGTMEDPFSAYDMTLILN